MSKVRYADAPPIATHLGELLRKLRELRKLPLRAVAEATDMDLAHLHKIELGQRLPTEEQTTRLAGFFKLDETETQAGELRIGFDRSSKIIRRRVMPFSSWRKKPAFTR